MKELSINQLASFIYKNRNNLDTEFNNNFYNCSGVDIAYSNEMHILTALHSSEVERIAKYAYKNNKIVKQLKKQG